MRKENREDEQENQKEERNPGDKQKRKNRKKKKKGKEKRKAAQERKLVQACNAEESSEIPMKEPKRLINIYLVSTYPCLLSIIANYSSMINFHFWIINFLFY
jgi:IS5 family transposase